MQPEESIDRLRNRFRDARLHRLGEQALSYIKLLRHPDLCWLDLLEALSYPPMISDDAAVVLRRRLGEADTAVAKDRNYWEQLILSRGLALESPCASYAPHPQQAPARPTAGVAGDPLDLAESAEGPAAA